MGGCKIQPKHTETHPMGAKAKLGLALLCTGDRKTVGAVAFHVAQKLRRK